MCIFLNIMLVGNISNKHIEHIAIPWQMRKMTVIIYPADCTVAADNAVFHVIQIIVFRV